MLYALIFGVGVIVFCLESKCQCKYEPLEAHNYRCVPSLGALVSSLQDYNTWSDEVFILVNNSGPSQLVLMPIFLAIGNPPPRHLIGITSNSGCTIDCSTQNYRMQYLSLHNLTVNWLQGDTAGFRTFTVSNFTYLGCTTATNNQLKRLLGYFTEVTTSDPILSRFQSYTCGYLTVFANNFKGAVSLTQADYTTNWERTDGMFVRVITSGSNLTATVNGNIVTMTRPSSTLTVNLAKSTPSNQFLLDVSDCDRVEVKGTRSQSYDCSVTCRNVLECVFSDDNWRSKSTIECVNSSVTFLGTTQTPSALTLDSSSFLAHGTIYLDSCLTIAGECQLDIAGTGWIASKVLLLRPGSLVTTNIEYVLVDYLRVCPEMSGSFFFHLPVTVLKAIQPGTVDVVVDTLRLWSHSSGIELVFDLSYMTNMEALKYHPIRVTHLETFMGIIPVNVRFEYGVVLNEVKLRQFIEIHNGTKCPLLEYAGDISLSGRLVFNYYSSSESENMNHNGFTPETSFFSLDVEQANGRNTMSVSIQGSYRSGHQLFLCLANDQSQCAVSDLYIWVDGSSSWTDYLTDDVDDISFFVGSSVFPTINLSDLNPWKRYRLSFAALDGTSVTIVAGSGVENIISSISMNYMTVDLPESGLALELDELVLITSTIENMKYNVVSIRSLVVDRLSLQAYSHLIPAVDEVRIVDLEDVVEVVFDETQWSFLSSSSANRWTLPMDPSITTPIRLIYPSGLLNEYKVTVNSAHGAKGVICSGVEHNPRIIVNGEITWPLVHVDANSNHYLLSVGNASETVFPLSLNTSLESTYTITLIEPGPEELVFPPLDLATKSILDVSADRSYGRVVLPSVVLRGSEMRFGNESDYVVHDLAAYGGTIQGSEVSGVSITGKISLLHNALLQINDAILDESEIVLDIKSTTESPTLLLNNCTLPKSIHIVHEFHDDNFSAELKWYWANRTPVMCWTDFELDDVMGITSLEVVGTENFHFSLSFGMSSGRQCAIIDRAYSRKWTAAMISGFVAGLVFLIGGCAVLVFKCAVDA